MTPQFQSEPEDPSARQRMLVDPESFDSSEEQFAASLDTPSTQPHFMVERPDSDKNLVGQAGPPQPDSTSPFPGHDPQIEFAPADENRTQFSAQASTSQSNADGWRQEVAERVNTYRSRRRPHAPRYPSLHLNFEPKPEPRPAMESQEAPPARPAPDVGTCALELERPAQPIIASTPAEDRNKIIPFPRSALTPSVQPDELAEPVQDQLRIIEAPEVVPPPPALGGMLIQEEEQNTAERRPGFEVPLQSARISRRMFAATIDTILVLAAVALFVYLFSQITTDRPLRVSALGTLAALTMFCWAGYQYLLVVYTGSTPGLKLTRLRLAKFDGGPALRSLRRWRVLASFLSGASLGLGFAWCLLDEDQLCWHDRITKTYIAPSAVLKSEKNG